MTEGPTSEPIRSPARLVALCLRLARAGESLAGLPGERIERAWTEAVGALLEPSSPERFRLEPLLRESSGLSAPNLQASLEAIARGLLGPPLAALRERAALSSRPRAARPALVVLAGNVPGLGLQTLLPALLRRRPLLYKCASAEPHFLPALIDALARREPLLGEAYAATSWVGGDPALEEAAVAACSQVLVYGGAEAISAWRGRSGDRLIAHGPKISVALLAGEASGDEIEALGRDVALFDQRGCLSVGAVLTTGDPSAAAQALAGALERWAQPLPVGRAQLAETVAVRRYADAAALLGRPAFGTPGRSLVVVQTGVIGASPGLRTVGVWGVASAAEALERLEPLRGQVQGIATAGRWSQRAGLVALGPSRIAPAGLLQQTDALWHDGEHHPVDVL